MRSLLPALGRRSPRRRWNPVPPGSRRPCWNLLRRSAIPWRCANQSGRPGRRGAPPPRRGVLGPRSRRRRLSGRPSGLANRSRALCQLVRRPNASGALSPSRHRPSAGGALSPSPRRRGSRSAIRVLFPLFRRLSAGSALLRLLLRPGRRGGRPPRRGVPSRLRRLRLSGCPSGGRSRGAGSALSRPPRRSSSGSRVLAPLRRRLSTGRSGNRALPPLSLRPSAGRSRSAIRVLFRSFRRLSAGSALLRLLFRPGRRGGRPPRRGVPSRLRRLRPSGGRSRGAGSALPRPPRRRSSGSRVLAPLCLRLSAGRSGNRALSPLSRRLSEGRSGNRALPPSSRPPSAGSAPSPLLPPPPAGAPLGPGPRPPPNRNPFPPPGGLPHLDRSAPGPRASSKASRCRGWWPGQGRGLPPRGRRHRKGAP